MSFDMPYNKPIKNLNKKINKIDKKFKCGPYNGDSNSYRNLSADMNPTFSERVYPMYSKDNEVLSIDNYQNMNEGPMEYILNSPSNINPERLKKKDLIILLKLARMKIN